VLANNPGIMTLEGTNTWVLRAPRRAWSVVVDPGPLDEAHLTRTVVRGGDVAEVLVTHHHHDHTEGIARFAELSGAPVRAVDPAHRVGAGGLVDGEVLEIDGLTLEVVATPGPHPGLGVVPGPGRRALLSGDTVLGRGTSVVAFPDGALAPYLRSLRRLLRLVESGAVTTIWPGHGPVVTQPEAVLRGYLAHREERLEQVRSAVAAGAETALDVVHRVYADVDPALWDAAERSVEAQLAYLRDE
jgi:glyoxylase-like metal-dependent hydrolase (beta-lactamase superfamily II)